VPQEQKSHLEHFLQLLPNPHFTGF
jgi:hypothetical protein